MREGRLVATRGRVRLGLFVGRHTSGWVVLETEGACHMTNRPYVLLSAAMTMEGGTIHTQLMAADLADELHLATAPLPAGQPDAPRFPGAAGYPVGSTARLRLLGARAIGDVVLFRHAPKDRP